MTALSPMGRVPQRRPVPPRVKPHRRPGPWLAFLAVLVIIAVVVWWRVLGAAGGDGGGDNLACGPRANAAVLTMDPKTVKVRVYNATEKNGLARLVSYQLRAKKFGVVATSDDPLKETRKVEGVAEIRYGPDGVQQALLISFWFPGSTLVADKRTDLVVDVAIGPGYKNLATAAQVDKAKQAALSAPKTC
jgi:hypothetical protein